MENEQDSSKRTRWKCFASWGNNRLMVEQVRRKIRQQAAKEAAEAREPAHAGSFHSGESAPEGPRPETGGEAAPVPGKSRSAVKTFLAELEKTRGWNDECTRRTLAEVQENHWGGESRIRHEP